MFVKLKAFAGETCPLLGLRKSFLNGWCLPSKGRVALSRGPWCFLHLGSHHTQWGWQGRCGMWTVVCLYTDFLFSFMCYLYGPCLKLALCPHVFTESMGSFWSLQCVAGTDFFPLSRYFVAFICAAFLVPCVALQRDWFRFFKALHHDGHKFTYLNTFLASVHILTWPSSPINHQKA